MKNLGLKYKLISAVFCLIVIFLAIIGYQLYQTELLSGIQDAGAERSEQAIAVEEVMLHLEETYSVIADGIINHNLGALEKDWTKVKKIQLQDIDKINSIVDTDAEKNQAKIFAEKYVYYLNLTETTQFVELKKNDSALDFSKIRENDDKIDNAREDAKNALAPIRNSILAENQAGDLTYDSKRNQVIRVSMILFIISLIGATLFTWIFATSLTKSILYTTGELSKGAQQITSDAIEMAKTSSSLAASATEQAAAIQETAASIEEMNSMIGKNAANTNQSREVASAGQKTAELGRQVVDQMIQGISEISQANGDIFSQVEESNQEITAITKIIEEIGNKTKVINDIVFQTKLLSFNASVEAARAGENGKGFAVVADEVGKLAQMSGVAAQEISELLSSSVQSVNMTIEKSKSKIDPLMQAGKAKIESGTEIAKKCGEILDKLVIGVNEVDRMIAEIAIASNEQSQGVSEITKAMNQLEITTQQNTEASNKAAFGATSISKEANNVSKSVQSLLQVVNGR